MIQKAIDKCNVHDLSNQSKFQMLYPLKNLQFSMNTVGPYGPSGGERVKGYYSRQAALEDLERCNFIFFYDIMGNVILLLWQTDQRTKNAGC